jgi:PAS domain S-box-containing protein
MIVYVMDDARDARQPAPMKYRDGASTMSSSDPSLILSALETQLGGVIAAPATNFPTLADAVQRVRMLETVIETVPVGVVVAEAPSGRIILGNRQMEDLVGHPIIHSADIASYGEWIAFHADGTRVAPEEWPLSQVIRGISDESELDVLYQRGDGERRWMRVIARPVRDADGQLIAAAVAVVDIDDERQLQSQQQVVIGELNHRAKNLIAVIKSIVSQTLRREQVDGSVIEKVSDRLDAYARAHAQMMALAGHTASVEEIARETLRVGIDDGRILIAGPHCLLPERTALALSMAFHELATNAVKHGALSVSTGTVSLEWSIANADNGQNLTMRWAESGGPIPKPPSSEAAKGFGSVVIDRALTMQSRGTVRIDYPADGMRWTFTAPLASDH